MLTDLVLAVGHHLLMFALLGVLVAELVLVRPGMGATEVQRAGRLDMAYGIVAGLIVVVGFARVFLGLKGPEFYLSNPFFWGKIAAFLVVGLLSVPPTMRVIKWRQGLRRDPVFAPPPDEIAAARKFLHREAMVFVLIPIFAALMARGYGF